MSADFAGDAAGARNPVERLWIAVVRPDVVMDGEDQVAHAAERAAPNAFAGDLGKPAFDLIERRRTRGLPRSRWHETRTSAAEHLKSSHSVSDHHCLTAYQLSF